MRRLPDQDDADTDRWMVSYADFITLMFAFFVVMYAISSVNDEKYRVLSQTLAETFAVDSKSPEPIQVGEPAHSASVNIVDLPDSTAFSDQEEGDTFIEDPVSAADSLLGGFVDASGVAIESNNDWLELSLDAEVLFKPGQASLTAPAQELLSQSLALLNKTTHPITIEGYTDNVPSNSVAYPSNWEMSAARASAVARFFVDAGIRGERISAVGYGENFPVATNATPQGRNLNRRVVIVVARRQDASRNLNANPESAAFAFVRGVEQEQLDPEVQQVRKPDGGLLFSTEPSLPPASEES